MNSFLRQLPLALVAALLWGFSQTAAASHFRFANLSWKRAPGTNSLAVEITVTEAWRSESSGPGEISYAFGDGSGGFTTAAASRIAILTDAAGEEYEVWRYTTSHTYPSNGLFQVSGSSCCRISTLVNAADASESFQMLVDLRSTANTGSPVTTAPVILQMQAGTNNSIALPIVDPDGDAFAVRLATSAESSIFSLPTVGGNAISVTAGGVLNWNTVGGTSGQKFALQVVIEENRAGNTTGTNGRVPLDFIIELAGSLTNLPPTVTGTNGSITIAPNQRFTATFVGTDPEGGPLRVNHQGLPPGATITPADGTTNSSPASVTFSWTPAPADVGSSYAVLIFFTDQGGLQRAASFALTVSAAAAVRDFELLSINSAGTASGSGASLNPVVSSNGQYVVFVSDASNLVANDLNGTRDVFWRDRLSGATRLVSRTPAGASGNGDSDAPVISPDGRYVAFHSRASNLTANDNNTNYDVFLWDAHDDSVVLVSRTATGASGAGDSFSPQLSASGRVVSFASTAADLVNNDTNGTSDAFARDLDLGVTYLASINTNGFSGNASCGVPVLSANGRYVAFLSRAGDLVANDTNALNDVFVHDLQTRVTTLVSVNVAGTGAGNRLSFDPVISADGRYIAFASQATNLVTIPDNNNFPDTFVRDMQMGVTKLVSVNRFGTAAGGNGGVPAVLPASFTPFLSADGTKVLFVSLAQDLVANDTNGKQDVFLRDHINNTTTLVSVNRFGTASGNAASGIGSASMSADLRYVAFFSEASNVGAADTNNKTDVFLRDLATNSTKIISRVNLGGFAASGHSFQPVISADGSTILFTSEADNLDNRDANGASDVFAAATTLGTPNFGIVDVAVSLTSVGPRTVGNSFTLTITVTNHSAAPATGLVVGNTGPDFLQFVSASVSQGAVDATVLNWQVGDLAANGSATATVTLVATNLGAGNVVSSIIQRDQLDANLNNNAALSTITANQTAAGALFHLPGETAYLSRTNSPFFAQILAGTVTVEDFESGAFNLLGVTASVGTVIAPSGITDSVDADDGVVDGNGNGGHSFFVTGTNSVTFSFNPAVFGRLPTKVGIVLTDGDPTGSGIEAFDTNGVSLGVIGPFEIGDNVLTGETAEDRFLGVEFAGGISALRVIYARPGFEVDHLQFDLPSTDLQLSGTAPSSAIVGSNFVVTLSVTNLGPRAVTSAVVTNAEPGPISLLNAVATTGAFDPMTGRWNIGGLAAGAGATLTLTVAATNLGLVTFESRVLSEAVDPSPTNNALTHTIPIPNQPPTLLLGFPASTNQVVESRGADYAVALLLPVSLTNVIALAPRGFLHSLAVQADRTVAVWGELNPSAPGDYGQTRPLPGLTNVSAVAAGFDHNLALLSDGTVVAWGDNSHGQTNVPAGLANVVAISSGQAFNVALKSDGTVVGWGRNTSGELAIPAGLGSVKAISAGGGHTLALLSNSTVVAWGANGQGQTNVPAGLSNVVAVSAGHLFSLALKSDGSVVGWGENGFGQASPPITISNATAIAAGFDNALALLADGAVVEWGRPSVTPTGFSSAAVNPAAAIATALNSAFLLGPEAFDPSVRVLQDSGLYSRSIIRTISPGPSGESNQSVTIFTTNANPAFFSVQPTVSSNGVLTFVPAAGVVGSVEVFFYAQDDGGDANGGTSTGQLERLTIYVLPVNHAPSLSLISTQVVVLEDAGAQSLTGFVTPSVGPTNEQPQNIISYTVSSTSPGLFQSQPAIALDGTLSFTPATNANGSALVTVVAQDNGGVVNGGVDSVTNTFTITVTNVNDAPSITLSTTNVTVAFNAGLQSVTGFATAGFGPPNESSQTVLGYTVMADNAALFATAPAISVAGNLTFTPASAVSGTANVSVTVQDSGGTANGGVDTFTTNFSITVNAYVPTSFTWLGGTGDWNDPARWSPNGVPGALDAAVISGGSAQLTNNVTVGLMTLSSGTVTGTGNLTVVTNLTWSAGTFDGSGTLIIPAAGTALLSGGSTKTLRRQFDNAGTVTWTGGSVLGNNNPTFNNLAGGLLDVQVTGVAFFTTSDSSVRTFNNAGTVRKSAGAGTTTWDGTFNNQGTLDLRTGTLSFTGNGLSTGMFTNAAGAVVQWTSGTHELTNGVTIVGPGARQIVGATLLVSAGATVSPQGTFDLNGGTLGGAGNFTVPAGAQFNWTVGTIATGGVFTVASGGAATLSGGSTKVLRRQLDNAGTVTWTGGAVQGNDSPSFNNQAGGVFDIQVDSTFFTTSDSSVRTFNNAGTVRKTAGTGTTTWQGAMNNHGTLGVQVGTLDLTGGGLSSGTFTNVLAGTLAWSSGTHELTNGAAFTGAGTNRISGGTVIVSAATTVSHTGTLELTGGALGGAGNFTVTTGSQFNWTAGTLGTGGVFTVSSGAGVTLSSGSTKVLRRQFNNAGKLTWTGGTVQGNDTPTFNNQVGALFDVQGDNVFFTSADSSVRTFNNAGTVLKSAGTGTTTWDGVFNSDGVLAVQTGTVNLTGSGLSSGTFRHTAGSVLAWTTTGTHELTNGVTIIGSGTARVVSGTVAISAGATVSHEGTFEVTGGTLGGAGNFTVPAASQFNWTGGTLGTGGVFSVAAGGTVTLSGGATKVLKRLFDNAGTVTWTGGTVQGNGGSPSFNNQAGGLLDIQTDGTFFASSDSSTRTLINLGTIRKSAGTGTTIWQDVFNNSGTVDIRTGTLQLTGSGLSSGTFTGAAGAVLDWNAGTHQLGNGAAFGLAGTRRVSGGTVDVMVGASLIAAGVLEVTGGTLGGVGAITVPADGTFSWMAGTLGTGGVFTVSAGATATFSSGSSKVLRRQFDNYGTVTWTGGQVVGNNNPTFNNQLDALFDVQADSTFFNSSDSSTPIFNNAGTLRKSAGTGTTTWLGTLNQDGLLELRQGRLTVGSTYNPGNESSFTVFLGGLTAATQFGQLVAGNIPFTGTLNVVLTNGFVPAASNSFLIVDGSSGSGSFTNTTGRLLGNGLVLQTNYSGGDLTLLALAVNTAPTFTLTNFPPTDGVQDWMRDVASYSAVGRKVLVDPSGNIIVAGDYPDLSGEVSQQDLVVVKYQPNGLLVWSNTFDILSFGNDRLFGMALDNSGNILLLAASSSATTNMVTLKLLANGTPAWTNIFDGGGQDAPAAVAVDSGGNVFVTGAVTDQLQGYRDFVTIKYAANGTPQWTNTTSFDVVGSDIPRSLVVDSNGDVIVSGIGSDTDYNFAFTVKISGSAGTNLWTRHFEGDSEAVGAGVDSDRNVYMAGNWLSTGIYMFAIVKYDPDGNALWTNSFTRSGVDASVRALTVDGTGNPIITGVSYNGTDADFTTIKYDKTSGAGVWTNHFDSPTGSGDDPNAIVSRGTNVFITGHSIAGSGKDYLTVKYTDTGTPVWTNRFDSAGSMSIEDNALALAVDSTGSVYVTGDSDAQMRTLKYVSAPSPGASQTVTNTIGTVSVTNFVVNSSVGTTNESAQTLTFVVTNDNNALFSTQPAISAAGTLTYTVTPGVSGVAVVTVRAQDNGGTANGGTDTSTPQSFNITVIFSSNYPISYVWGGGSGNWNDSAQWTPPGVPGVADTASVSSGTVQFTNAVTVGTFTLGGGFITGAGSLTIASSMTWSGGSLGGSGAVIIPRGVTLTVEGAGDKDLRRQLDNYGTVTWTAGRILGHDAATINNHAGAVFGTQTDATLFESGDGTTKTFNNTGTIRKSASTGTSTWSGVLNQNGTADIQTGTLNPSGAPVLGNSSYTGAGRFLLTGATLSGTLTIAGAANVELTSGTLAGTGTVSGLLNWTGGTVGSGTLTIATNGSLLVNGAVDKDLRGTLDNYGTVTWNQGRILGHDAPVIQNRAGAIFSGLVNSTLFESGDGTVKAFNNAGTVRKAAAGGTATWNGKFNNSATVRAEAGLLALNGGGTSSGVFTNHTGATLQFSGGTHTVNAGALFTGAGTNEIAGGLVSVAPGGTASVAGTFAVSGGTLGGGGRLLVTSGGVLNWTGGAMSGTTGATVITNGATLVASGSGDKDLRRRLDNHGTVTWTAGRILGHATPVINNYAGALFDTQTDSTLYESGDGTTKTFNNAGTVRKSGGAGTSTWSGVFNQSGTADVQTGTLNPAGALTLNTSTNTGTGRFLITGATLAGTLNIATGANVELASGAMVGAGTVVGTLNWTSGTIGNGTGLLTVATNGSLVASSASDKDLRMTLENYGAVTWTAGRIVGHATPIIYNRAGALFDGQVNNTLFESGDGTVKTFNNAGTTRKSAAAGNATWNGLFNNNSVLLVESGDLSLNGGGASAGLFTNASGTITKFTGGTHTLNDGAVFTGGGAGQVNGGTVNNAAGATTSVIGTFGVASGTLGGTGTLLVNSGGQFNWTGGAMAGTTGRTIISSGATLTASTTADKDLRRILDNYGAVTWTAGRIVGHATPIINNYAGALFDTQTDGTLFESGDGTTKTFYNFGTVRKSGGPGTSVWYGMFNSTGTIDAQFSTLYPAGMVTLGTVSVTGAGRLLLTGVTLTGTVTVANGTDLEFSSGTLSGSGTIVGTLKWSGGTMGSGGTTTIAVNGTLFASGSADKDLRRTLNNYGTVTWSGSGRILGHDTPVLNNLAGALFDVQSDTTLFESGDGTVKTFQNSGTVRKRGSTGITTWNGVFNNSGALELHTGTLQLASSYTPAAGSSLTVYLGGLTLGTQHGHLKVTGSTTFAGTLNIVLTNAFTPSASDTFLVVDSSVGGSGAFSPLVGGSLGGGLSLSPSYLLGDLTLTTLLSGGLPPLSPQATASERLLRWAGGADGYVLESAPAVTGPWTPVLAPVAQDDSGSVVRLPAEGTRFYRLVPVAPPRPGDNPTQ